MSYLTRRSALRGGGVVLAGVAAGFAVTKTADLDAPATGRTNDEPPPSTAALAALATLDAVPVGGGVVLGEIVLTRPADGEVHGFSAVCTHLGCKVDKIVDGRILCPCHGSAFDASTGAVVSGPAGAPLGAVRIDVRDGQVFRS